MITLVKSIFRNTSSRPPFSVLTDTLTELSHSRTSSRPFPILIKAISQACLSILYTFTVLTNTSGSTVTLTKAPFSMKRVVTYTVFVRPLSPPYALTACRTTMLKVLGL